MTKPVEVTQADRDAVTAFHRIQAKRIMSGDKTLGDNRDTIEEAFARHRQPLLEALERIVEASQSYHPVALMRAQACGDLAKAALAKHGGSQ